VQVYARSFPEGGHKIRASAGGARWPAWDSSGNLYYWQTGENVLQVVHTLAANGELSAAAPVPVWAGDTGAAVLNRAVISVAGARYDVDPRGTRFLVLESATADARPELAQPLIVLGWPKTPKN
jgi:hypothetical protein